MGTPEKAISFLTDLTSWHSKTFLPDTTNNFDSNALAGMTITSSTPGRMVCKLPVTPRVQNRFGSLHGGCIATLVDDVSSGAIVSVSPHGGVSVSMSMTYLSPTPGNQDCEIDAKVVKAGKTLAFADVEIRNKKTGKVTARGTHIKFIPQVVIRSSGDAPIPKPVGTPKQANHPEAAESFIDDMCSEVLEGFAPEATQNFDTTALYGLRDIKATPGKVVCTLPVQKRTQNSYGTLHGGCTATLVDVIGSAAIFTVAEHSGVSLQISIDYLSEMPGGEECEITATVAKLGRSTATAVVELRHKRTKRLTARGTHVKFLGNGLPEVRAKL